MARKIAKKGIKKSVSISNCGTTTATRNNSYNNNNQHHPLEDHEIQQQQQQQLPPIQDVYDAIESCFENGKHIVDCIKNEQYELITEFIIQNKIKYSYHDTTTTITHASSTSSSSVTQPYLSSSVLSSTKTTSTATIPIPIPMTHFILDEHINLISNYLRTVCDKIHIERLQCNDCKCIHTIGSNVKYIRASSTSLFTFELSSG